MPSPNYTPDFFTVDDNITTPSGGNEHPQFQDSTRLGSSFEKDETNTDDSPEKKRKWGISFFTDTRWKIVLGVIFIIIAAYLLIAVISYFFTGAEDQSELEGVTIEQLVQTSGNEIKNLGGPGGALISNHFVTHGLGIGVIPIIIYMIVLGLALLGIRKCNFWSATFKALLLALTLSIVFGLFCFSMEQVIPVGGYHGYYMNMLVMERFGWPGAVAVSLILIGCVVGVYFYDIMKVYGRIKKRWDEQRAIHRAAEEERQRQMLNADEVLNAHDDEEKSAYRESDKSEDPLNSNPFDEADIYLNIGSAGQVVRAVDENTDINDDEHSTNRSEDSSLTGETVGQEEKGATEEIGDEKEPETELTVNELEEIEQVKKLDNSKLDPTAELSRFKMPVLNLLKEVPETKESVDIAEIEDKKNQIIEALSKYGIGISKIEATVGPTVTMYEIVPAEGVKIATIKRLEEDIAMALAALSTRIIAPIPGKSAIGIEVPNREKQMVAVHTIFGSKAFQETEFELPIALGATIDNQVYIADLAKMPHLLVAGATGKGKSVGMNIIINSLLYKKHPSELKLVLIDPKMVEFYPYRKLVNHYLAQVPDAENAIITETSKVVDTLNSLCVEMDDRYRLLQNAEVVKITHYNDLYINKKLNPEKGHRFLPYIVVIVDEYADLLMTAGKEIETPIARLAQKARAVGIHVIIATQRPSANIITGVIKGNFPARIAFKVTSYVDSNIILGNSGAFQLIGNGDMLISQDGEIQRVQCAFISTDEIKNVAQYIGDQAGFGGPFLLPEPPVTGEQKDAGAFTGDFDPLISDVARAIVSSGTASTSNIQRNYQIGYNRAGRIMDQLHVLGIVGPQSGSKPRDILVDNYRLEEILQEKGLS